MTERTENNLRQFQRSCLNFWQRQWYSKPDADGNTHPAQVSYEDALVGVYADMKVVIDKPNVHFAEPGDIITEADCERVFNTEFSEPWSKVKEMYIPKQVLRYKVIPNYHNDNE